MNGEFLDSLDSLFRGDPLTSQLSVHPQLESLVNSSFCKPFLEPLGPDFLLKIFPAYVGPHGLTGPDCVKTVIQQQDSQDSSLSSLVEQLDKLFDGYINYFTQFPQESHFQPYVGEEIRTMAEHLKKKLSDISTSHNKVIFILWTYIFLHKYFILGCLQSGNDDVELDQDLINLMEIFPNHNRNTLKVYLQDFAARQIGGILDVDGLIHEILMKDSEAELEEQPVR